MKKYVKPEIAFEDFTLSTNIASGCEKVHAPTLGICALVTSGELLFFNQSLEGSQCELDGPSNGMKDNDSFCYHVPDGGPTLFSSL